MKHLQLLTICLMLTIGSAYAQGFSGIATYKSDSKMQLQFNSSERGATMNTDEMEQALRKALQKDYELHFNKRESVWKEIESLGGTPKVESGGMQFVIRGTDGVLYKNIQKQESLEENYVFGKVFLVDGELNKFKWKLHDEYKNIGSYKCQKATFSDTRETKQFTFDSEEGNKEETVIDTINYMAWFTADIPVSHGPEAYWGLPGLIMEVTNGSTTMICSKLTLNPKEGISIEKPSKGKKVSEEEYAEIRDKKMEEMSKQYQGEGGHRVIIRSN